MANLKRFYTYAYLREDRSPYYIGKGEGNRAYKKYRSGIKPPKNKSRIIFLKQNLIEEEAFRHEIYMIAVFGRKDLGTGILHNRTNGGEGVSGRVLGADGIKNCSKAGTKGGKKSKKLGSGIHGRTQEQMTEDGKKGGTISGKRNYELGLGIHGRTKEQMTEDGKKAKKLGLGYHGRTQEQMTEDGKKGAKTTNSQKWMCLETRYISNSGGLSRYQKARGIDTSKRKQIS
jgi:hypothetical protein